MNRRSFLNYGATAATASLFARGAFHQASVAGPRVFLTERSRSHDCGTGTRYKAR